MRMADKPGSNIVLAASHILLMYLSDNVYRLKKQEAVRPSYEHAIEHFLIGTLPLSDKLGLQLSNHKSKSILALLYARRTHIVKEHRAKPRVNTKSTIYALIYKT